MRVSTNSPGQHDHQEIRALDDQREGRHRVEQHRQLELVALVVGALRGILRPSTKRPMARSGLPRDRPAARSARARATRQQAVDGERQQHLHEHGIEDGNLVHLLHRARARTGQTGRGWLPVSAVALVVGRLAGDGDAVRVALGLPGRRDAHEPRPLAQRP